MLNMEKDMSVSVTICGSTFQLHWSALSVLLDVDSILAVHSTMELNTT